MTSKFLRLLSGSQCGCLYSLPLLLLPLLPVCKPSSGLLNSGGSAGDLRSRIEHIRYQTARLQLPVDHISIRVQCGVHHNVLSTQPLQEVGLPELECAVRCNVLPS